MVVICASLGKVMHVLPIAASHPGRFLREPGTRAGGIWVKLPDVPGHSAEGSSLGAGDHSSTTLPALNARGVAGVASMSPKDEFLTNQQTASMLGVSPTTLEIWRCRGKGPAFIKYGDRPQSPIRYRLSEVMRWVEAQSFASTSAYSAADRTSAKSISCPPSRATA